MLPLEIEIISFNFNKYIAFMSYLIGLQFIFIFLIRKNQETHQEDD